MTERHTYPNARRLTEAQERMIWAQEIQPILTKHFNSALRYKWFPEPAVITSDDLVAVWDKLLLHLLDADEDNDPRWTVFEAYTLENPYDPDEFLPGVMMFLKAGMPDTERGVPIGDLKTLFFPYLRTVMDDGSLPVFLSFLAESGAMLESVQETNQQQPMELDSPEISRVLIKGWRLRESVDRLSEESELVIWNMWVKPIVDLHYNGSIHYSHADDFKKITPDDFGALWEQYIAPIICSNTPPWLKYPQSMDQGELESLIGENIWEPEDFVSEVMLLLKAGRAPGLVDPFFRCLTSIITKGELPVFLAYIAQDRRCGDTTLNVLSYVWNPGVDFSKDRMTQQDELAVWDRWIAPIIDKHFKGRIEYKFFDEPEVITPDHIGAVLRKMLEPFVYDYEHGPFPTDDFLKEVMDRLRAGFHKYEGVDLIGWFNDFLSWIMDGGHLPAFLAYIDHERGGDGCETEQAGTSHEASPVPIAADKNKWSFTLKGPMWYVTFDGEAEHVTDGIPVRRMLPALEQPGVKFGYIQLVQMTSGPGGETQTEKPDGLSIQTDGEGILTKHDLETWQLAAIRQHKRYKENPGAEGGKWNQFKAALQNSGYYVIESEESVQVKESKFKPDIDHQYKKAGSTVGKNRTEFLKKIRHLPKLHDHMEQFLKRETGLIYDPPKGSLAWKIIK
jgi:hypothetical protein